jgi:transposase-like protein
MKVIRAIILGIARNPKLYVTCKQFHTNMNQGYVLDFKPKTPNGMAKKQSWSPEEKEEILKEAKAEGVRKTLARYKLSAATYSEWKRRYESEGLDGLRLRKRLKNSEISELRRSVDKKNEQIKWLEQELELYRELSGKLQVKDIPLDDRIALIKKYNKAGMGIKLAVLRDICQVTKYGYDTNKRNQKRMGQSDNST